MKKSAIKDIYYGDRGHTETIKESDEYWKLLDENIELIEKLKKSLTKEQQDALDKINFLSSGLESAVALTHFTEGFKLGLLVGVECAESE